jgi:hypothetical protein
VPISQYRDMFGNLCSRIVAPVGPLALRTTALLNVSGAFETRPSDGWGHPVQPLADDSLLFLLGSRYCETDLLVETVADVRPMRAKTRRLRGGMHYASLSLSPTMRHAQALQRLIC